MGDSGRKQFRLDAGSAQGEALFYACETRARSVTWGERSRRNTQRCYEIPIKIERSFDQAMRVYDLTDPETFVGDLTLRRGESVKFITETNPSVWGRYDLDG